MCTRITLDQIIEMIPKTVDQVNQLVYEAKDKMNVALRSIGAVKQNDRNYYNTLREYDSAKITFDTNWNILKVLAWLDADSSLQFAANNGVFDLDQYNTEHIERNVVLYDAFKEYKEFGKDSQRQTRNVKMYLDKKIKTFEHNGLLLSVDARAAALAKEQEANDLGARFNGNVTHDIRTIVVPKDELGGVPKSFLDTLQKDQQGNYRLPTDMKTFFTIMENCTYEPTRRTYFLAFGQRAYPTNLPILEQLIQKRNEFAHLLGHTDFATYQYADQMAKTPKRVEQFLWDMVHTLRKQDEHDFMLLTKKLSESVELTKDKKMKPWDEAFIKSYYRKYHFNVNDHDIAQYFPLEHTLDALLDQFKKFFHIDFEQQECENLWAQDVICYRVRSMNNQGILGYLFLDLYQREHKQVTEPQYVTLIPTISDDCNIACVGASVMMANLTQSTEEKPTLLDLHDVKLLFHELGHAIHALFGATPFVDVSGTNVVKDFIEAPSQMLEFWLDEPEVLQAISSHYQTGHSLQKDTIEQILAAQAFGESGRVLKQLLLALVGLHLFKAGYDKDIHKIVGKLYKKVFRTIAYEPAHYFELGFSHLANYAASYYMYVWSRVIAADLFHHIKEKGLSNHQVAQKYIKYILSPGGLRDPNKMLKNFLGRPFNNKAFLEYVEGKR